MMRTKSFFGLRQVSVSIDVANAGMCGQLPCFSWHVAESLDEDFWVSRTFGDRQTDRAHNNPKSWGLICCWKTFQPVRWKVYKSFVEKVGGQVLKTAEKEQLDKIRPGQNKQTDNIVTSSYY